MGFFVDETNVEQTTNQYMQFDFTPQTDIEIINDFDGLGQSLENGYKALCNGFDSMAEATYYGTNINNVSAQQAAVMGYVGDYQKLSTEKISKDEQMNVEIWKLANNKQLIINIGLVALAVYLFGRL